MCIYIHYILCIILYIYYIRLFFSTSQSQVLKPGPQETGQGLVTRGSTIHTLYVYMYTYNIYISICIFYMYIYIHICYPPFDQGFLVCCQK